jgi:ubiquinone/menaquinone biosynthesis C-methylase UbiE
MTAQFDNHAVRNLTERYTTEASAYLDHWAPVLHPISCKLIEDIPERPARRVLDLGAGVGKLLPVLRNKFGGALVVGIDRSEGMLSLAGSDAPLGVMDALGLGIQSDVFDVVVMAFVLFHFPDPLAGLKESRRVLRPGGAMAVTTWANDMDSPAVHIWNEELEAHGAVPAESLQRVACHELMDTREKVRGLLESAGYVSVRATINEFRHTMRPEEFTCLRTLVGASKQRLESLDENARGECIARAAERLSQLSADDFTIHMQIILAHARSPY